MKTAQGRARERGQDQPSHRVHRHACGQGHLAERASQESQVLEDLGDDREGGDRESESEEADEHRSLHPRPGKRVGEKGRGGPHHGQGHEECPRGDGERRAFVSGDDAQIGLEPDDDEQHDHTEPRDAEHDRSHGGVGKDPLERSRGEPSEDSGTEDDAGQQLAHHRRLSYRLHQPAGDTGHTDQQHQLHQEYQDLVLAKRGIQGDPSHLDSGRHQADT